MKQIETNNLVPQKLKTIKDLFYTELENSIKRYPKQALFPEVSKKSEF